MADSSQAALPNIISRINTCPIYRGQTRIGCRGGLFLLFCLNTRDPQILPDPSSDREFLRALSQICSGSTFAITNLALGGFMFWLLHIVLVAVTVFHYSLSYGKTCAEAHSTRSIGKLVSKKSKLLFNSQKPIEFTIALNWTDLIKQAPVDSVFSKEERAPMAGFIVSSVGTQIPVSVRNKGNTSLGMQEIPKFKLRFADDSNLPAPFTDLKGFSVNTHAYSKAIRESDGFAIGEDIPFREACAYELARAFDIPVKDSRGAHVEYFDSSTNQSTSKPALLLEPERTFLKRLGLEEVDLPGPALPKDFALSSLPEFALSKLVLFNSMIGNWDYFLPNSKSSDVHNLVVGKSDSGAVHFFPEDFDRAAAVTGRPSRMGLPDNFKWINEDPTQQYIAGLIDSRKRKRDPTAWSLAVEEILPLEKKILAQIEKLQVDEMGRENFKKYALAFFKVLKLTERKKGR